MNDALKFPNNTRDARLVKLSNSNVFTLCALAVTLFCSNCFASSQEQALINLQTYQQTMLEMSNDLFANSRDIDPNRPMAVGTFLPLTQLDEANIQNETIGLQLQESFVTLAMQAGLTVVEFKVTSAIHLAADRDIMLSRQLSELRQQIKAKYYLTGTYSSQSGSLLVNARVIEVATQQVLAATTTLLPNLAPATSTKRSTRTSSTSSTPSRRQVTLSNGAIYRGKIQE